MILERYLFREVAKPLAVVLAALAAVFASYSAARFLDDAVNGLLPGGEILALTALKLLISLEVLIPISLYVSVIIVFGRLYGDSEFAAMFALRATPWHLLRPVALLSLLLAGAVGGLSLFARPWAYRALHHLSGQAAGMLESDAVEAGSFYVSENGTRVIYVTRRDGPDAPGREVFVRLPRGRGFEIVSARLAYALPPGAVGRSDVYLSDAYIYEFDQARDGTDQILHANGLTVDPDPHRVEAADASPVATPSGRLWSSCEPVDIAERQWRLSTPLSTLLLGLLGVPLSRRATREGGQGRVVAALGIYFGYYLLITSARTWVQNGVVPAFPGIWWVPALLGLLLWRMLVRPGLAAADPR